MANSVDPERDGIRAIESDCTLFAKVSVLVCEDESVKGTWYA